MWNLFAAIPYWSERWATMNRDLNFRFSGNKAGAVLPLVLVILLAVTLLLTSLLQTPGGLRLVALRRAQMQQQIYDAESAVIAYLEGFPEGYFPLPKVERSRIGPWADLSVNVLAPTGESRLHVLAGIACDSACNMLKSPKLRREIYEGFKQQLNREITMVRPPLALQIKSGNRRITSREIFGRNAFGRDFPPALWVQEGDLSLDLDGGATGAEPLSGRFMADGSIEVRGSADFDTLRLYARGPIYLRGSRLRGAAKIRWLEAFSEDRIEIARGVEFTGVVIARHEVVHADPARPATIHYPSFLMGAESSQIPEPDSTLVPVFISGKLKPFLWSLR